MDKEQIEKLLGRKITERMVEIWNGINCPPKVSEQMKAIWQQQKGLGIQAPTFPRKPNGCGCKKDQAR